ncbi:ArsR family transcriptional regulator [Streptomyces macrosporus]|uniref:ATP-binding protein n=1 Tax=Streptomyces macrosporus TaxID=44032 RepID=A0ABN3JK02_9ACTN
MSRTDVLRHARPDIRKPAVVFDRDAEWEALTAFARDPRPVPGLGIVSGRLRQGKTYLLEALTRALDGFYFGAQEAAGTESLNRLGDQLALHTGTPSADRPRTWEDTVDALLALGDRRPLPVVVDEFPHLVRQCPSLPSVVHGAYRRLRDEGRDNHARLLLCGSDLPMMRRLFSRPSPLHGLADLELEVRPLDFRQAAAFWGIDDPRLAFSVHAIVGGTPAYRRDLVRDDAPAGPEDFDAWVCRTVLDSRTPIFWEAHHLLQEEADHQDRALCHSALAAVSLGCATIGGVADCLDTGLADVSHCLELLRASGLLRHEADAFRPSLTRLRIAEPLLAFEHAVVWPQRSALEQEGAADVWRRARAVFESAVAAPHFAQVCRDWAVGFAAPDTFGGEPGSASHGSLPRPEPGAALDAEVVVRGHRADDRPGALLSVGSARLHETMDLPHLERLRRLLALLAARGEDVGRTRPACYGGAGFTPALREAEARGDVVLVDLDRLHRGR